jgi:hypothetical protein
MEKLIRIQKSPAKKGYIESVNISGNYLKEHGFKMGDFVKLTISKDKIIIEKTASTNILQMMGAKDARLFKVIENL